MIVRNDRGVANGGPILLDEIGQVAKAGADCRNRRIHLVGDPRGQSAQPRHSLGHHEPLALLFLDVLGLLELSRALLELVDEHRAL